MSLDSLLNKTCTIQAITRTQDSSGQKIATWADTLAVDIACRIDPKGGGKTSVPEAVFEASTHVLFIRKPDDPTITTEDHRVVLGGNNYEIILVAELYATKDISHLELWLRWQR